MDAFHHENLFQQDTRENCISRTIFGNHKRPDIEGQAVRRVRSGTIFVVLTKETACHAVHGEAALSGPAFAYHFPFPPAA